MNPNEILHALNEIDDTLLLEARNERTARRRAPRLGTLIAAVIILTALAATAFAAEEIAGWFKQYFMRRTDAPLSSGQIQFIEENEQIVGETQKHSGYSLELNSVLSDQETVYMTLRVTAPESENLDPQQSSLTLKADILDADGKFIGSATAAPSHDADTPGNALDFVLEAQPSVWNDQGQWILHVRELTVLTHDREYEQELLNTKYKDKDNILFTDEEAARIYQYTTLAEGPWEFIIDPSTIQKAEPSKLEMVTTPVTTQTCYGYKPDGTPVLEDVSITSFILRPLGATIQAQSTGALDLTYNADQKIFVVMKDGSRIQLLPAWGAMGEQHLECASPIALEDVDHILLPDGSKLITP